MRLRWQADRVVAQFSFLREAAWLAEREACWVPLYLPTQLEHPIGDIHSTTHEVRLRAGQVIADRQVVVLGTTPNSEVAD